MELVRSTEFKLKMVRSYLDRVRSITDVDLTGGFTDSVKLSVILRATQGGARG
jgi:hypothetical protein